MSSETTSDQPLAQSSSTETIQTPDAIKPLGVFIGQVEEKYGLQTAIDKKPVSERIFLSETGLVGDECADNKHHGGPERALHQYPVEHYAYWLDKYGQAVNSSTPDDSGNGDAAETTTHDWSAPGMGENISSRGMLENNVCIGDQYQWGEAIIEVSQPRSPCFKLNRRWQVENFSVDMQEISRCGWLYRVIQTGYINPEDSLILIQRPDNAMTIEQVCEIFFGDPLNQQGLEQLRELKALSNSWSSKVEQRLEQGIVENWNFRLLGHA